MSKSIALEVTFEVFSDLSTLLLEAGYNLDTAHRIIRLVLDGNTSARDVLETAIEKVCA